MLLTLSTTMPSAGDLGFLLHKHPDRAQAFEVAVGTAHVVWPAASDERASGGPTAQGAREPGGSPSTGRTVLPRV